MIAHKAMGRLAGGVVIGLLASIAAAMAQTPQLNSIWPTGNLRSGGSISYRATVSGVDSGTNTLMAVLSGKGFKTAFGGSALATPMVVDNSGSFSIGWNSATGEVMIPNVSVDQTVNSALVSIPAKFSGRVTLTVTLLQNGSKVESRAMAFDIPKATGPANETSFYDVGFSRSVTLDTSMVNKATLGARRTYKWTQLSGPTATLDSITNATVNFTTASIDNIIFLSGAPGVVGINAEQVAKSTYVFRVVISDGRKSVTGKATVICASMQPGQQDLPLGVKAYLKGWGNSNGWQLLSAPSGSTAALQQTNLAASCFQPDKAGIYTLTNTLSRTGLIVTGSTFVGVNTCANCHGADPILGEFAQEDLVTLWSMTGHATKFENGVNGKSGATYSEDCLACHTVGFNKAATASNNGFDDAASAAGWTMQKPLKDGNYDNVPDTVKAMGGIQCESCHGPGSNHPGPKSASFKADVCMQCHQDGNYHVTGEQWQNSPHANTDNAAEFTSPAGNTSCSKCHTPAGFVDNYNGVSPVRTGLGKMSCQACHDPHDATNPAQLRIYDTVTLDTGTTVTEKGSSAICMYCHNARTDANAINQTTGKPNYLGTSSKAVLPHNSTAAEVLGARGGVTYGLTFRSSYHGNVMGCVDCHMGKNPNAKSPDHNHLGEHTFSVSYTNDAGQKRENVAVCNTCHSQNLKAAHPPIATTPKEVCNMCHSGRDTTVRTFDHKAYGNYGDYDGNGRIDGVQTEVQGLITILKSKLASSGVTVSASYPYFSGFSTDPTLGPAQRAAAWNCQLIVKDGSLGVHNPLYTIELLQASYTNLSETTGGGSFKHDFPRATVR